MSFEEYKTRQNSVYNEIQNLLKTDQNFKVKYENSLKKRQEIDDVERELASQMRIGERCECFGRFRGVLLDVCKVSVLGEGLYCKVLFDEPPMGCGGSVGGICGLFDVPDSDESAYGNRKTHSNKGHSNDDSGNNSGEDDSGDNSSEGDRKYIKYVKIQDCKVGPQYVERGLDDSDNDDSLSSL